MNKLTELKLSHRYFYNPITGRKASLSDIVFWGAGSNDKPVITVRDNGNEISLASYGASIFNGSSVKEYTTDFAQQRYINRAKRIGNFTRWYKKAVASNGLLTQSFDLNDTLDVIISKRPGVEERNRSYCLKLNCMLHLMGCKN